MIQASIRYSVFAIRLFGIRYLVFEFADIRSIRYSSFFTIRRPLKSILLTPRSNENKKNKAQRPTMRPQVFLGISSYRNARMKRKTLVVDVLQSWFYGNH